MTDQKKDPLGKLRRKLSVQNHNHNRAQKNISKLRAIAKVGGIARGMFKRGSVSTKNAIKANRDKHLGRPGLYRSCRPVHAFDTDATVAITKSWGVSTSNSGDFVVVGEPKASTNWMNDICKFNLFDLNTVAVDTYYILLILLFYHLFVVFFYRRLLLSSSPFIDILFFYRHLLLLSTSFF